jgi:hypothetical protein
VCPGGLGWLPAGKRAAVCFSVDDIHPRTSEDSYEAGGDLAAGALGRLMALQRRHPHLKATLCVTPDWRLDSLAPDAGLRHIPGLNRHVHWTRRVRAGRFRLDRHPKFASFLKGLSGCEVVPHGLTHSHTGPHFATEFQRQSEARCTDMLRQASDIFRAAGIDFVPGYVPPSWSAPATLIRALQRLGFRFLSSARDLETPVSDLALTAMSGLQGVSLIHPHIVGDGTLVHLTCNYQATSSPDRAFRILELGGVLHIKAHIFKSGGGHVMLDGLDETYCGSLDRLFSELSQRFGEGLWWAHLSEVADRVRDLA